ncbi:hypothetical protein ABEB36_007875 [Hypothenemus hampei]
MNNYIPQIRQNNEDNREIKITDMRSKEKQKRYADMKRSTVPHRFVVGEYVLCKQMKRDNLTPHYDPNPYKIIRVAGTTITAQRKNQIIKRNSFFFKKFMYRKEMPGKKKPEITSQKKINKRVKFRIMEEGKVCEGSPNTSHTENGTVKHQEEKEEINEINDDQDETLRELSRTFEDSKNEIEFVIAESSEDSSEYLTSNESEGLGEEKGERKKTLRSRGKLKKPAGLEDFVLN